MGREKVRAGDGGRGRGTEGGEVGREGGMEGEAFHFPCAGSSKVGYPHMTEVMLEGGASHTVDVTIERHGTAIAWEFSTEPKGIAFGIGYRESKKTTREDEVSEQGVKREGEQSRRLKGGWKEGYRELKGWGYRD